MTTEQLSKTQLLIEIQQGFEEFEILIGSIRPELMDLPGVCDQWSIKDNIAHLSAWHKDALDTIQALQQGTTYSHPLRGKGFDVINEVIYQANKERQLDDVLEEFRSTYRQLYKAVQETSEEDLHRPLDWLNGRTVLPSIIGNSYEHYQEHASYIQRWLKSQNES